MILESLEEITAAASSNLGVEILRKGGKAGKMFTFLGFRSYYDCL